MTRPKNLLKKLLLSLTSLLVLCVAGELVTRALEPGPFALFDRNPYVDHPEDPRIHRHAPDFAGRWDGTWYETNSLGLRGPELEPTFAADELRVVAIGDSCTFGKGVVEADTWPRQLERRLADELVGTSGPWRRVLVANLGTNGYSGATYERIFRDIGAGLKPQIVLVGYNLNDFPNVIRTVDEKVFGERGLRKLLSTSVRDFLGRFALYRWARQTYYHAKRESDWRHAEAFASAAADAPLDSGVWRLQEGYLKSIRDLAAEHGGRVAVFLFPYESQVYLDSYDMTPIERLRQICRRLDLPFVDLADEFRRRARESDPPRRLFLKGDRYHPDPGGYAIVAERVADELRAAGWLEE